MKILKKAGAEIRSELWLVLVIVFTLNYLLLFSNSVFAENIIIICNKDVSETALDKTDIIKIFLGKKTEWQDSQKINFAIMRNDSLHKAFLKQHIGKTKSQFRNYWRKKVFTGKGRAPKKLDSSELMVQFVAKTSGAVGYISEESLHSSVKKLSK
ncbi:hypothetical protein QUF70_01635 [Desulfobacterales bacterium HSG17]|nr:hypothetical protein [Desulfobacterales bacterium HSG17]